MKPFRPPFTQNSSGAVKKYLHEIYEACHRGTSKCGTKYSRMDQEKFVEAFKKFEGKWST